MGLSLEASLCNVGVILPAGGKGMRVGGMEPKQFLPLGSAGGTLPAKPMLMYALESFHRLARVKSIARTVRTANAAKTKSSISIRC